MTLRIRPGTVIYVFDAYVLDTQGYTLQLAGRPVCIRPKAFQVLNYLLTHRDRVISKQELAETWS
jgi:DNA-binding winged helix-turn-helix (wHTH) protein